MDDHPAKPDKSVVKIDLIKEIKQLKDSPKIRQVKKDKLKKILGHPVVVMKVMKLFELLGRWQDERKELSLRYNYLKHFIEHKIDFISTKEKRLIFSKIVFSLLI